MGCRVWTAVLLTGGVLLTAATVRPARAEHFDILVRVTTTQGRAESTWDTSPPPTGLQARPMVRGKVGEPVELYWEFASHYPHGVLKDVRVRLCVAEQTRPEQEEIPATAPRLVDNSFTADIAPGNMARGVLRFHVRKPGLYRVHLGSELTLPEHGHEHFAAVDLKVE